MKLSIIAALTKNRVIGKDNSLPWSLPNDMRYFKRTTINHHVLMGRKNWESIPEQYRPLVNRVNWILTRDVKAFSEANPPVANAFVIQDIDAAMQMLKSPEDEMFVIGGGEIYKLLIDKADKLYLTEINAELEGDIFFPEVDMTEWTEISRIHNGIDEKHAYEYDFVVYERNAKTE